MSFFCAHCGGEYDENARILGAGGESFCCGGCQKVREFLRAQDLGEFYERLGKNRLDRAQIAEFGASVVAGFYENFVVRRGGGAGFGVGNGDKNGAGNGAGRSPNSNLDNSQKRDNAENFAPRAVIASAVGDQPVIASGVAARQSTNMSENHAQKLGETLPNSNLTDKNVDFSVGASGLPRRGDAWPGAKPSAARNDGTGANLANLKPNENIAQNGENLAQNAGESAAQNSSENAVQNPPNSNLAQPTSAQNGEIPAPNQPAPAQPATKSSATATSAGLFGGECEVFLVIKGIHCAACVWLLEKVIARLDGVLEVSVSGANGKARVVWDDSRTGLGDILRATALVGYAALPYNPATAERTAKDARRTHYAKLIVAIAGVMNIMWIAVALYSGYFSGLTAAQRDILHFAEFVLCSPVLFYTGSEFYKSAWLALKNRTLNMDASVIGGASAAYAYSVWAMLTRAGEVYFDSVAMVVAFVFVGKYLQKRALLAAVDYGDSLGSVGETKVRVLRGAGESAGFGGTAGENAGGNLGENALNSNLTDEDADFSVGADGLPRSRPALARNDERDANLPNSNLDEPAAQNIAQNNGENPAQTSRETPAHSPAQIPVFVDASEVGVGEIVLVENGEKLLLDGVCVGGEGLFDYSALTGESLPASVGVGAALTSGGVCVGGAVRVRVEKKFSQSCLCELSRLIETARLKKSRIELAANRIAAGFSAVVLALALAAFAWWASAEGLARGVIVAMSVLIISCPCALSLATPVAALVGMSRALRSGLVCKESGVLERIAACKRVVFDKTGTLTRGEICVRRAVRLGAFDERGLAHLVGASAHLVSRCVAEFLRGGGGGAWFEDGAGAAFGGAAGANSNLPNSQIRPNENGANAANSNLPVGADLQNQSNLNFDKNAVQNSGKISPNSNLAQNGGENGGEKSAQNLSQNGGKTTAQSRDFDVQSVLGGGLIGGGFVAGSVEFLRARGVAVGDEAVRQIGENLGFFVAFGGELVAVFELTDELKSSARPAIAALQKMGYEVSILSGDRREVVARVASELGVGEFAACATPAQKLAFVAAHEPCVFVGDGVNDAAALGAASVGVAVGGERAAALSAQNADAVLIGADLAGLAAAVAVARVTRRRIYQNLAISLAYNACAIPLAFAGAVIPLIAAAVMSASSLCVVLNALRR